MFRSCLSFILVSSFFFSATAQNPSGFLKDFYVQNGDTTYVISLLLNSKNWTKPPKMEAVYPTGEVKVFEDPFASGITAIRLSGHVMYAKVFGTRKGKPWTDFFGKSLSGKISIYNAHGYGYRQLESDAWISIASRCSSGHLVLEDGTVVDTDQKDWFKAWALPYLFQNEMLQKRELELKKMTNGIHKPESIGKYIRIYNWFEGPKPTTPDYILFKDGRRLECVYVTAFDLTGRKYKIEYMTAEGEIVISNAEEIVEIRQDGYVFGLLPDQMKQTLDLHRFQWRVHDGKVGLYVYRKYDSDARIYGKLRLPDGTLVDFTNAYVKKEFPKLLAGCTEFQAQSIILQQDKMFIKNKWFQNEKLLKEYLWFCER